MNRSIALGLAMLAGAALGAIVTGALHAQGRPPGAFAVIDVSEIIDPDVLNKQIFPKETPSLVPFGGQYVMRTQNVTGIDGTPPKRFIVIAFGSLQAAKAWSDSAAQKEIDALRMKSTKSRAFIVDATID
jgi:uncharacterized protein (DUF1330 family)